MMSGAWKTAPGTSQTGREGQGEQVDDTLSLDPKVLSDYLYPLLFQTRMFWDVVEVGALLTIWCLLLRTPDALLSLSSAESSRKRTAPCTPSCQRVSRR